MYIALIGNSHFGPILTKQLNEYDNNSYRFYNTNENKIDKIKFALNLPFIDVVYSVSASISGGGALNLALRFNKKIVQHFIGSDVLSAQIDFKNKNINQKLIENSHYLCEVNWIQEELTEINISSEVKALMVYERFLKPKLFEEFSVLTYMGKGKELFYGIEHFIKLAKDFPHIQFKIAGIESYANLPVNIRCLGWINMMDELQNSTVFIRNAKHDGLGFSIIEALSLGRVTFYNYDFPYVNYFEDYNDLKEQFCVCVESFNMGKLLINDEAIAYAKSLFNKERVLNELVEVLGK